MQITVKTTGLLREYLPTGSERNLAIIDIEDGDGPLDVMRQLGMPPEETYLIVLNGSVVPTDQRPDTKLNANDELGIFPPLTGG